MGKESKWIYLLSLLGPALGVIIGWAILEGDKKEKDKILWKIFTLGLLNGLLAIFVLAFIYAMFSA